MAGAHENGQSGNLKSARMITGAGTSRGRGPARSCRMTILQLRHEVYDAAQRQHPTRWSPSLPRGGPVTRATGVTSEKSG